MPTLVDKVINAECDRVQTGNNYRRFKREELGDLLGSVKRRGLIQPVIITDNPTQENKEYRLVAGERRFRCCEILGMYVKAVLKPGLTEEQIIAIQLVENIKKHINSGELAESAFNFYKTLLSEKLEIDPKNLDVYSPKDLPAEYRKNLSLKIYSEIIGRSFKITRK